VPDIIHVSIYGFSLHSLAFIIAIMTLWQANILFSLFMLVWAMLFITAALLFSKHLTKFVANWSEFGSIIIGKIVDVLSNILSVRLFAHKDEEKRALKQTCQGAIDAEEKLQWSYCWMWLCYGYSFAVLQIFNFYFLVGEARRLDYRR
jgi:ATP-binding cassette subfamily B protein